MKNFFLGIGAQKAGTTYLNSLLEKSPSIHMPKIKELHFWDLYDNQDRTLNRFSDELRRKTYRLDKAIREIKSNNSKSFDEIRVITEELKSLKDRISMGFDINKYKNYFQRKISQDIKVTGEITPSYGLLSKEKLLTIKAELSPKIIYIMRNPISRVKSHINFEINHINEASKFTNPQGKDFISNKYLRASRYSKIVKKLDQVFEEKNICYLFFEDLINDTHGTMRLVTNFLEIEKLKDEDIDLAIKSGNKSTTEIKKKIHFNHEDDKQIWNNLKNTYDYCIQRFPKLPIAWMETINRYEK